jgi:hypothetical protein
MNSCLDKGPATTETRLARGLSLSLSLSQTNGFTATYVQFPWSRRPAMGQWQSLQ